MDMGIAENLVALRTRANLTQESLGEKVGVSRQAVSKWERGESAPDLGNVIALADLYGVTVDEVLGRSGRSGRGGCDDSEREVFAFSARECDDPSGKDHDVHHVPLKIGISAAMFVAAIVIACLQDSVVWVTLFPAGTAVAVFAINVYVRSRRKGEPGYSEKLVSQIPMACILAAVFIYLGSAYGAWHPGWMVLVLTIPWAAMVHVSEARVSLLGERA